MNTNLAYQDEYPCELINGQLVMMSPRPVINHNYVAFNIARIFANYLTGKSCTPLADGVDLHLTEKDCFIPDFMVVCDSSKIKEDGVYGAPDLVVEVLSPSTAQRDRIYKKEVYLQTGVKEYWLVDVKNKSIEQYFSENGQFVLNDVYSIYPDIMLEKMSEEEKAGLVTGFKCSLFDDLIIRLEDVFERVK